MESLLSIAVAMLSGLLMSRVVKRLNLPAVTGYLVAGLLIGPFVLGRLGIPGLGFSSLDNVQSFQLFTQAALGFIAFSIGNEFRLSQLKETGKKALIIGIVQALVATIFVDIALVCVHFIIPDRFSIESAITLGAIASATAPATTLMVVRQYKAKGKITDLLLPIVAIDDAVGLIVFAISFGIAKGMKNGSADLISIAVEPLLEIILSLLLGGVMGYLLTYFERFFHSRSKRLSLSITFVLISVGISLIKFKIGQITIGFSTLLVCMMLGTIFCNLCTFSEELMNRCERWTAPLYLLFFVLSGAELNLNVFQDISIVIIGIVYILFRSFGKYFGSYSSAAALKCDPSVSKYLGITLLPQEGVALGMSVTALSLGPDGILVRNIVLFSVLVYELLGPFCTKMALTKSGDIIPEKRVSSRGKINNC